MFINFGSSNQGKVLISFFGGFQWQPPAPHASIKSSFSCLFRLLISKSPRSRITLQCGREAHRSLGLQRQIVSSWWFQPNWKILVKLDHFPRDRGEHEKQLSCHHLGIWANVQKRYYILWNPDAWLVNVWILRTWLCPNPSLFNASSSSPTLSELK